LIIGWPAQIRRDLLSRTRNLRAIQCLSAGVENLQFDALPSGVKVFSNAGAYSVPVAEHAWALVMTLAKGTHRPERKTTSYVLRGKTLLILGAGGIGSEAARIGKYGFSMRVIGVSRSFKEPELYDERYGLDKLDEVIGGVDVIIDSLPLNKYTKGILNYKNLSKVKRNCIIVNVGRGETVDEEGVYKLLKERKDVRFGTDVFWRRDGKEDFNSKLWELENFAGTRHTAGAEGSPEILENAIIEAVKNAIEFLKYGKAKNEVKIGDYI